MARTTTLLAATAAFLLAAGCGSTSAEAPREPATVDATRPAPDSAPATTPSEAATPTAAAAQQRGVRLKSIGRFESPVYVTSPPQDARRLMVVEQAGRIVLVRGGKRQGRPFLDIRDLVRSGGEQGLLSVAFPRDYRASKRFYVYYTDRSGDQRIVEYRAPSADAADPGSARLVLKMDDEESNHNGGLLLFGSDGLMYVGTGDGGGGGDPHGPRGNGQNLGTLLGKILRIDPRRTDGRPYAVPRSNPFVGRNGARGEIYAYGLRNPWRFSFDRRTGDLTIGDVGQDAVEEIDFVRKGEGRGANFGWRPFEGSRRYTQGESAPGHVRPVIERTHEAGWCSITGGVVVRDPGLPALAGRYVFGDICQGRLYSARLATPRAKDVRRTSLRVETVSSFGEDARGRVYAVSLSGPVYRLVAR